MLPICCKYVTAVDSLPMLPYVTYFPSIQIHLHAALQPSLADDIRTPLLPAACLPDARMHGIDIIIVISAIIGH